MGWQFDDDLLYLGCIELFEEFTIMDDLIPKILTFPPVPAPSQPLSDFQYDQSIRAISQLLTSTPAVKLASGLATREDVFDVSMLPDGQIVPNEG